MFCKYLKLMLFLTVAVQASPKLFNSYGNQMEAFQNDCQTYQKLSLIPNNIKKKCKEYNSKANRAFKYGYKLDPNVDNDNIDLDKVEKYNTLLRDLEERKENILLIIYYEATKARKELNIDYYTLLVSNSQIELHPSDYKFMKTHKSEFSQHPQYLKYKEELAEYKKLHIELKEKAIKNIKLEEARMIQKEKEKKLMKERTLLLKKYDCAKSMEEVTKGYKKILTYIKNGMPEKAYELYQVTLNKKRICISKCDNSKLKQELISLTTNIDNVLMSNPLFSIKNAQHHAIKRKESLENRVKVLENDIENLSSERERIHEKYERKRKALDFEYERRIKKMKRKVNGY